MLRAAIVVGVSLVLTVSASAYAEGLYDSHPVPMYLPFSWSGFYIGGNGGYSWDRTQDDIRLMNSVGVFASTKALKAQGGFGGGQVGFNVMNGWALFGLEADLQGGDITDSYSRVIDAGGDNVSARRKVDYFGTVRARVGGTFDHVLIYATGGFAYGNVKNSLFVTNVNAPGLSANLTEDKMQTGYTIGGGLEYAIDQNWSLKAEYQRVNFGTNDGLSAPILPPNGINVSSARFENTFDTVRLGLNYRFGH